MFVGERERERGGREEEIEKDASGCIGIMGFVACHHLHVSFRAHNIEPCSRSTCVVVLGLRYAKCHMCACECKRVLDINDKYLCVRNCEC